MPVSQTQEKGLIKSVLSSIFTKKGSTQPLRPIGTIPQEDLHQAAYPVHTLIVKRKAQRLKATDLRESGTTRPGGMRFDYSHYVRSDILTPSGRKAFDIGDVIAEELRGNDLDIVYAKVTIWLRYLGKDVTEEELRDRYKHLNAGLQRMNLGNIVRGALKNRIKTAIKDKRPVIKGLPKFIIEEMD